MKLTRSQLKKIIKEELAEIRSASEISPEDERHWSQVGYRQLLDKQLKKVLSSSDAKRAGVTPQHIDRFLKGIHKILSEE